MALNNSESHREKAIPFPLSFSPDIRRTPWWIAISLLFLEHLLLFLYNKEKAARGSQHSQTIVLS